MKKLLLTIVLIALSFTTISCNNIKENMYSNSNIGSFEYDDNINKINITLLDGEVNLVQVENHDKIKINIENENEDELYSYIIESTLYIYNKKTLLEYIPSKNKNQIVLTIYFPSIESIEANLMSTDLNANNITVSEFEVKSKSGNIKIDNIKVYESNIKSNSGKININNISSETLNINTKSGSVTIENNNSNYSNIKTTSGKINIGNIKGENAYISSSSGDVVIDLIALKTIDITNNSGNIYAYINDNGINLYYKSNSGNLKTDLEYIIKKDAYVFGDGLINLNCKSKSGDLNIYKNK